MDVITDIVGALADRPVHKFWCPSVCAPRDQVEHAVAAWHRGEAVEFHAHICPQEAAERGRVEPHCKFVMVVMDMDSGEPVRPPLDLCWRLS